MSVTEPVLARPAELAVGPVPARTLADMPARVLDIVGIASVLQRSTRARP